MSERPDALAMLDAILREATGRELYPASELVDQLLDLRSALVADAPGSEVAR